MESEDALMEIIVGTYEKFLVGYILKMHDDKFSLTPSFATEAHLQCIKCVASSNKYLVSGSTDETIQLFNMKTRKEIGALVHHNGSITSLEFIDSYLISSSEDATICIWSTNNWQCVKTLGGHKKSVNCISIHPSGKLALSVSKDKTVRTWNLINGRSAYATNIKKVAEIVKWTPDGSQFVVACNNALDIYSVGDAAVRLTINFETKICDFTFIKDDIIAVGGENESIHFYDLNSGNLCHTINAHTNRIKALKCVSAIDEKFLVSASSNGCIRVWHITEDKESLRLRKIAKAQTGNRLTSMTVMLKN
ncbi:p21-activated protein kinase-interacting protein 1-like [Parasteatoda tepidariorum]|uniref:p21-activated protein kinase-interacting protein 1-like n=1 Tax=Parasteatoda tepidariorum TaxID=114398 RepID=UPI00077F8B82|nr:p21-activated protein kinase-interacting protein 1-like [Parasteatoda tepidariorum]